MGCIGDGKLTHMTDWEQVVPTRDFGKVLLLLVQVAMLVPVVCAGCRGRLQLPRCWLQDMFRWTRDGAGG